MRPGDAAGKGDPVVHTDRGQPERARYVAGFAELMAARGTNYTELGRVARMPRQKVSAAAKGHQAGKSELLVTQDTVAVLDRALHADGRLLDLWRAAAVEDHVARIGASSLGITIGTGGDQDPPRPTVEPRGEVNQTDRRQFVELGALSALAASTQQRMDAAVTFTTLDELEADADEIARVYGSAPHASLLPEVGSRWRQIRAVLDGPVAPEARPRVTTLGGQFTYFLGRLAFNANDMRSARRFAGLAARYADEVGDPVLILSIAALRSSVAYWRQEYGKALNALRAVGHLSDPYMDARIAAYEARTYAALGDAVAARAALDRMEATAGTFAPRPGSTPVGPAGVAMFRSGVALSLGDAKGAREWAPIAVSGYQSRGGDFSVEEQQHAALTLAVTHLMGTRPEPEEAARLATSALDGVAVPTHTITSKIHRIGNLFADDHRRIPEVAAFTDAYRSLPALPSGGRPQ